jgi:alcohol dehydrogenase class IV
MALDARYRITPTGDRVFSVEANRIKFGPGALHEIGDDAAALGLGRVALFTDPVVATLEPVAHATESLRRAGIDVVVYGEVAVEPTDESFKAGARFAREGRFDGYVSVGGGSVMDTCKAANLYATHPVDDFLAYVNAPIGAAWPVPGPLRPHIACPTTFGTASECTGIAIFDLLSMNAKTGIASRELRPTLGVLDPANLKTLPGGVVAANGFDVLSHAIESYTARPFTERARPAKPGARPLSQGANPYSDVASLEAIRLVARHLEPAIRDAANEEAREALLFAGMLAGIGFGNAGCHLPHGMSYAVSGLVREYRAPGYPPNKAMVPHGISVIVNAPAVFRFTSPACPDRHRAVLRALGGEAEDDAAVGELLARRLTQMMHSAGVPSGLEALGYGEADIHALAEAAFPQRRLLDNAPRVPSRDELAGLFRAAMREPSS